MLPTIDPSQVISVLMTTQPNAERLREMPPAVPFLYDEPGKTGDKQKWINENAKSWDIYKDIVQLSFYYDRCYHHFLMCDSFDTVNAAPEVFSSGGSQTTLFTSEEALLREALGFMWTAYGGEYPNGKPCFQRYLAGWHTHQSVWPMLSNRALKYHIPVLQALRTDPEKKWPTVYSLVDIASIYIQGGGYTRDMPELADLLRYWGVTTTPLKAVPSNMAKAVCDGAAGVLDILEPYLLGIHKVVCDYYPKAVVEPAAAPQLAGLPVPSVDWNAVPRRLQ